MHLTEYEESQIETSIRECYNEFVSTNSPVLHKFEKFDLLYIFKANPENNGFQASLVPLSECRIVMGELRELSPNIVYGAWLPLLDEMKYVANEELLTALNAEAVSVIHDCLCGIFENLTNHIAQQLGNR